MKFMEAVKSKTNDRRLVRLPEWLKKQCGISKEAIRVKNLLKQEHLNTVCQEAGCPNIVECFKKPTATFMILGDVCTRQCRFCGVNHGKPCLPDAQEPERIGRAVSKLELQHVVITSVTRDDLEDGGAFHFADTIHAIHQFSAYSTIEALIPDFNGNRSAIHTVVNTSLNVLNHNVETVPRLYSTIRPQANYCQSLHVLEEAKLARSDIWTKSGLMVGLGETFDELKVVFQDLVDIGCDALTIGQYLSPGKGRFPVQSYVHPDQFKRYEAAALAAGIPWVKAGPFVRSSYNAKELMDEIRGDVCA